MTAQAIRKLSENLGGIWKALLRVSALSLADEAVAPGRGLCISIGKSRLTVASGTRLFSKVSVGAVKAYPHEDKESYPAPNLIASIDGLAPAGGGVTLSIPKSWVVMKTAEFPSAVKENLAGVLSYELDRLTPFSSDEALYDYRILGAEPDGLNKEPGGSGKEPGKVTVLVAAAKAELVGKYVSALREKGIAVDRVSVGLFGAGALCRQAYGLEDFIFASVEGGGYELALFKGGIPVKTVSGKIKAGSDAAAEIIAGIDDLEAGWASPVPVVAASEDAAVIKAIREAGRHVSLLSEGGSKLTKALKGEGAVHYEAVGGLLESLLPGQSGHFGQHGEHGLNLLSRGRHVAAKTPMALTAVLSVLLLAIVALYLFAPVFVEEKRLADIERRLALRKEEAAKVEALRREAAAFEEDIGMLNGFKSGSPPACDVIREMTALLPNTAWLTRLKISESSVELEGYARSATAILSRVEASEFFDKAEFSSPIFRDATGSDRFIIRAGIENAAGGGVIKTGDKTIGKTGGVMASGGKGI